jgi:hypothetical protein
MANTTTDPSDPGMSFRDYMAWRKAQGKDTIHDKNESLHLTRKQLHVRERKLRLLQVLRIAALAIRAELANRRQEAGWSLPDPRYRFRGFGPP